jgi:hypothetical protein
MHCARRIVLCLALFCAVAGHSGAQQTPTQIQYNIIDLYALRNYPFTLPADSLVREALARYNPADNPAPLHEAARMHLVSNPDYLERQLLLFASRSPFLYKNLIAPYLPWIERAAPIDSTLREIALPVGWQDEAQHEALYAFLGKENGRALLDQLLASGDPFRPAFDYHYFFSNKKQIDGETLLEIAFYPNRPRPDAFTGYIYLTEGPHPALVQAVYTRSTPHSSEPVRNVLWTQRFSRQENKTLLLRKDARFVVGDLSHGNLMVHRIFQYTDSVEPFTAADSDALDFLRNARRTRAFRNVESLARLALTDRLAIGGPNGLLDWGPVTQSLSFNAMEGLRLRVGGNTTTALNPHFLAGGYVAYGTKDEQLKYRADLLYSLLPKDRDIWEFPHRLFSFSYARDLNLPGQELLNNRRDAIYNSFTYTAADNMSLQTEAVLAYDHELAQRLSFRVAGRYLSDEPQGNIRYPTLITSEVQASLRYAPREIFLQNRERRIYLRRAPIEWNVRHRMGLQRVFGSDHRYHITDFSARLRRPLPAHAGYFDVRLSAGKVWNRLPFPLLFIPKGNQSYIYDEGEYNRMRTYEFVADQFVGLQADVRLYRSPLRLLTVAPIQPTMGVKALYGPLSERNLQELPPTVHALGRTPYVELHLGLTNIFSLFRIEWVQRVTYGSQGGILFGFGF